MQNNVPIGLTLLALRVMMMTMTWKILLGFQSYQVNPKTPVLILSLKK
jgi:hypothetical protein